ncbi:MAG TPA: hypothetical protein VLA73_04485, partial [Burkholderiales bacterium]|nr:hypothetical protein [Burkholderiales bacterium]
MESFLVLFLDAAVRVIAKNSPSDPPELSYLSGNILRCLDRGSHPVIPAQAGIQDSATFWTPAFAGVTDV